MTEVNIHPEVVDAQLHIWELESRERPWISASSDPIAATIRRHFQEEPFPLGAAIQMLDSEDVAAALVVAPSIYGTDNSYSFEAVKRYPERLRAVALVDRAVTNPAEHLWELRASGAVGLRLNFLSGGGEAALRDGAFDGLMRAAELADMPVCQYTPRRLDLIAELANRYPNVQLLVDHLGLPQPPVLTPDPERFQRLSDLLALARFDNVAVKASAVPALSAEQYPFADVWGPMLLVLEAFTPARVMWGTDYTRVKSLHTYSEAVNYLRDTDRLSAADKAALLGGSLRRIYRWPKG
jgi:predicted TIM-barrel fold metal-dependent hydrolase